MFTFEDGPENATEHPVKVPPFNTIVGAPPLAHDLSAKAGVLWFEITFETPASCYSEVRLYCLKALTHLWPVLCCINFSDTPAWNKVVAP